MAIIRGLEKSARMLIDAGCKLDPVKAHLEEAAIKPEVATAFDDFLLHSCQNAKRLKDLCRISLRRMLGRPLHNKVNAIDNMPWYLKDFVLFKTG